VQKSSNINELRHLLENNKKKLAKKLGFAIIAVTWLFLMPVEAYMIKIESGAKSSESPVVAGQNVALFNVKFFRNKQLHCANIESSAKQVSQC